MSQLVGPQVCVKLVRLPTETDILYHLHAHVCLSNFFCPHATYEVLFTIFRH